MNKCKVKFQNLNAMKSTVFIVSIIVTIILFSCTTSDEFNYSSNDSIVLQERDPKYPLILSQVSPKTKSVPEDVDISNLDCLGRSIRLDYYPYDDERNIGYAVIDINKAKEKKYLSSISSRNSFLESFSFYNYDRYLTESYIKEKTTSGFELDFGFFSIGNKTTMQQIFQSYHLDEKEYVAGECNVFVKNRIYDLQYSDNIRKYLSIYALDENFKGEIYNTQISDFFNQYGAFVLRRFFTGGRASALFYGRSSHTLEKESLEILMGDAINAGVTFKGENGSVEASLDLGLDSDESLKLEYEQKFSELQYSVKTKGGDPIFPSFFPAKDLINTSLDLSGWLKSLSDESTHAMIEIDDEGLIPISDLILEKNVGDRLNICLQGLRTRSLCEPEICIYYPQNSWGVCPLYVYLHTRNNEYFILNALNVRTGDFTYVLNSLKTKWGNIFKTKIVTTNVQPDNGYYYNSGQNRSIIVEPVKPKPDIVFTYYGADLTNCVVYYSDDDMLYLLDQVNKMGYSIHSDYLLDTYAIRDFVEKLPVIDMEKEKLLDYNILAL